MEELNNLREWLLFRIQQAQNKAFSCEPRSGIEPSHRDYGKALAYMDVLHNVDIMIRHASNCEHNYIKAHPIVAENQRYVCINCNHEK